MSHVQSTVTTVMVRWPSIFELTLSLWSSEQLNTVSVRLRLLSLGCSSCSDADPGTLASTRCVQHCSQRHRTTPFPTSQDARSASLEPFRVREHECAHMGWLCRRVSCRGEIVFFKKKKSPSIQKGNAQFKICSSPCTPSIPWRMLLSSRFRVSLRSAPSRFRSACFRCRVAPTRRSTVLSAPLSFLFRALLVHRIFACAAMT